VDIRAPLVSIVAVPGTALRTLAATDPRHFPVLFDSAAQGALARYSLLAFQPRATLSRDSRGRLAAEGVAAGEGGFLDHLEAWYRRESRPRAPGIPSLPFMGGWFVYLGYEMAAEVEPNLQLPPAHNPCSAFALRVVHLAVHDAASDTVYAISEDGDAATHARLVKHLEAAAKHPFVEAAGPLPLASITEENPEHYLARVRRAKEHIAAGDIYQANLSRPWLLKLHDDVDSRQVYGALRRSNPAPFAASWRAGLEFHSSSPERLMRISGREISTRPIAGTRPRAGDQAQDRRDTAELVSHPKERAEHVMLIDWSATTSAASVRPVRCASMNT